MNEQPAVRCWCGDHVDWGETAIVMTCNRDCVFFSVVDSNKRGRSNSNVHVGVLSVLNRAQTSLVLDDLCTRKGFAYPDVARSSRHHCQHTPHI